MFLTTVIDLNRMHLCNYDLNFTYPQGAKFPTVDIFFPSDASNSARVVDLKSGRLQTRLSKNLLMATENAVLSARAKGEDRLSRRAELNASAGIDPVYGCDLWGWTVDYANKGRT